MTLPDLITRLEQAEGGSRELDAALWAVLRPREYRGARGSASGLWPRGSDSAAQERAWAKRAAPAYTTSVDAALALIGELLPGAYVELSGPRKYLHIPTPSPNVWRAALISKTVAQGWGATAALALLIALLRALQSQDTPNEG